MHRREQNEGIQERADTVVSVVYVTAAKTFAGPIGGYQTLDGSPPAAAKPSPEPEQQQQQTQQLTPQPSPSPEPAPSSPQPAAIKPTPTEQSSSPTATAITQATEKATHTDAISSQSAETTQRVAHGSHTSSSDSVASSTFSGGAASSAYAQPSSIDSSASSATSSAPSATKTSSGMSGGAKAGLAFGIIIAIGALIAIAVLAVRRKKRQNEAYEKTADEKAAIGGAGAGAGIGRSASVQTSKTSETAPRLSLRPVTQFLPDLAGKRKSGNLLGGASVAAPNGRGDKPTRREQANNPANPFGNHAEMSEKAPAQYAPNHPANPFSNHAELSRSLASAGPDANVAPSVPAPLSIRSPSPVGKKAAVAGVGAVAGAAAVGAMAGHRQDAPKPLNLTPNRAASPAPSQPSPAGTEFSMTPASPASFANGPPPSNVHRVQMDFKPSMDDELGLRAGQLVRLLHEYDDGWVSPSFTNALATLIY